MPSATRETDTIIWRDGHNTGPGSRRIPEETAIALSYNGTTQAVMMATPLDLEDYGVGFSLSEGQVSAVDQIQEIDIAVFDEGIDIRLWVDEATETMLRDRRRRIAGPTGCGLCGIESLTEANRPTARTEDDSRFQASALTAAQHAMFDHQKLNAETRAVHAAGLWRPDQGLVRVREDVGRHNALDKLVGATARAGESGAGGVVLLTSRVSVEMVQKSAVLGAAAIVAVSAPTALAVRTADAAGITLVALARDDGFEIFSHPERIVP